MFIRTAALALVIAAVTAPTAMAQRANPPGPIKAPTPKLYKVEAVQFTCVDESGWDGAWYAPVSDEPYWIFSSVGPNGTSASRRTSAFQNVDTGDVVSIPAASGSVFGSSGGAAASSDGIGVSIQLWEEDDGDAAAALAKSAEYFKQAGSISASTPVPSWVSKAFTYMGSAASYVSQWLGDDLLGTQTFAYTQATLDGWLPAAGYSFSEERTFQSADATYRLRLRVTRTA